MSFAQLTYRESLRNIEACLRSNEQQGISWARGALHIRRRQRVARLADLRRFRASLIAIRPLYAHDPIGVDLDQTLHALFPWAKFRKTKGAVKMHTLLDLHGNIPTFIRISGGKVHDVNILDEILPEAGAFIRDRSRLPRFAAVFLHG